MIRIDSAGVYNSNGMIQKEGHNSARRIDGPSPGVSQNRPEKLSRQARIDKARLRIAELQHAMKNRQSPGAQTLSKAESEIITNLFGDFNYENLNPADRDLLDDSRPGQIVDIVV